MLTSQECTTPESASKKKRIEWFKHDADAARDEKLLQLRAAGGWEYVGLWWALVELLTQQDNFALKAKSLSGTAILFALPADKFQAFLDTCVTAELLKQEEGVFYSPSLCRRLSRYCEISEKRAQAGAKGAASKGEAKEKESEAIAEQLPSNCPIYSSSSSDLNSFDSLGGAGGADCTGAAIPAALNSPEVKQAITRWRAHLRKNHKRNFDPIAEEALYASYATRREELIRNIEWSVQNGWKTINAAPPKQLPEAEKIRIAAEARAKATMPNEPPRPKPKPIAPCSDVIEPMKPETLAECKRKIAEITRAATPRVNT